ncbi:hypothetical protein V8B97DRAFT_2020916 [Scleroderma yunnanense]
MLSTPSTHILNVADNVIYVKVTSSLSKWDTHFFSVNILSPGVKKVVLHLKDTVNNILPPERKGTLEKEVLEQVEEASSKLKATCASLWIAYEGTIGIQEVFGKVNDASCRLDAIWNKLSVLRDGEEAESPRAEPIKAENADPKLDLASRDFGDPLKFEPVSVSPCCVLSCHTGNPNPDALHSTKPWAYCIIPFDPLDIPMQFTKRKMLHTPASPVPKCAKLEAS